MKRISRVGLYSKLISLDGSFLILAIIVYLPFANLILEILDFKTSLPEAVIFWLAHWYEPVLVLLFLILLFKKILARHLSRLDFIILALIFFGLISALILTPNFSRGLEGFRFSFFPLLIFFTLAAGSLDFNKGIFRVYKFLAQFIAFWAILERLCPPFYYQNLGVISATSSFGFGYYKVGDVLQSASVLGGPNQTAAYLLPAFFLIMTELVRKRQRRRNILVLIILFLAIILTFSRSAAIGLIFAFLLYALFYLKKSFNQSRLLGIIILLLTTSYFVFRGQNQQIIEFLTHGQSQNEHWQAYLAALVEIKARLLEPFKLIFGAGSGTAGPVVIKYGGGFIPESWYIQLLLEFGLLGLTLWFWLIALILQNLLSSQRTGLKPALAFGIIAVSIAAFFLHSWADNPPLSLTLFALAGFEYGQNSY